MDAARILIIEDDESLNEQLGNLLRSKGFHTTQHHDGQEGLLAALRGQFDLILLDVLLPTLDGFSVLSRLRKRLLTPVMMLTACGAEAERIEGYSQGADDYLPKPFNFKEMMLRIEALLRRSRVSLQANPTRRELRVAKLLLNRIEQKAWYGEQELVFTPIQFRLLWVLVENRNEVLTKPYLYQMVLERGFSYYDRSLDMHLSRVRRKLVDAGLGTECLITVHGKGYKFC